MEDLIYTQRLCGRVFIARLETLHVCLSFHYVLLCGCMLVFLLGCVFVCLFGSVCVHISLCDTMRYYLHYMHVLIEVCITLVCPTLALHYSVLF